MGPADVHGPLWTGILLSASLLIVWSPLAAAQFTLDPSLQNMTPRESLAKPNISVSQSSVIEQRATVYFSCVTSDVNITIHWVFNNAFLVLQEGMHLSADGKTLTILTVQRKDSGPYQCEVRGFLQVQRSEPTFLDVYYGPDSVQVKLEPGLPSGEVVNVIENSTVNFWVETETHPLPDYSWFFPNGSVSSSIKRFTINAISREHEGLYRCLVSNSVTDLSLVGAVEVRVVGILKPHIVFPNLTLVENASSVSLTCQSGFQEVGVQWFLSSQPLLPSERLELSANNRTLAIHGLRRDDTGPYECEVWNLGNRARSDPVRLNISYGPDQVDITRDPASGAVSAVEAGLGSSLTLKCWAEAEPVAEYLWSFEHNASVSEQEQLVIEPLSWEHQGLYTCTAVNPLTRLTRSALVLVTVVGWPKPVNDNVPGVQEQVRAKKMLPPVSPEHFYEIDLPSATGGSCSRDPGKVLPMYPSVPPRPKGNMESNYQVLVNPESSIYSHISSQA
ncbi:cell adhesion molecule CEACAM20 isoform X2 [Dasypus novemcinctus]|uniref:cell adhesion molecule CEACAM20 isoform X2 n=1 Tax=Dasypus novemcinctus TaxID=9361 RepID=UPI00265E34F7|nr:carcinoembryonic antigen-related cell adhesion molecule 20 isoform X2 [Dasypus novemcinctus]